MAKHTVEVEVINSATGLPASKDNIFLLVSKAVAHSGLVLDTVYKITSLADAETTLGITAAQDTTDSTAFHQHISEFYDNAPIGTELHVVGIAKATGFATYLASSDFLEAMRDTKASNPLDVAKIVMLAYEVPAAGQTSADFPTDVTLAIAAAGTTYTNLSAENIRTHFIIDCYNMDSTKTIGTIGTMATKAQPHITACITGTKSNRVSGVGLAGGCLAKRTVGESIGSGIGKDPVVISTGTVYLTNGNLLYTNAVSETQINTFGEKQFLYLRKFGDNTGYYWNDDATCDLVENSLSTISANRIANKVCMDMYNYLQALLNSNTASARQGRGDGVIIDVATGNASKAWCMAKEEDFHKKYVQPLVDSGDVVEIEVKITGVAYTTNKTITATLRGVAASALQNATGTFEYVISL